MTQHGHVVKGSGAVGGVLPGADPVGGILPGADPVGGILPGADPVGGNLPGADPVGGNLPDGEMEIGDLLYASDIFDVNEITSKFSTTLDMSSFAFKKLKTDLQCFIKYGQKVIAVTNCQTLHIEKVVQQTNA